MPGGLPLKSPTVPTLPELKHSAFICRGKGTKPPNASYSARRALPLLRPGTARVQAGGSGVGSRSLEAREAVGRLLVASR